MKKFIIILFTILMMESVHSKSTTILFLGDSLSEGQGVDEAQSFPRIVERKLKEKKFSITVINGGLSGATSASGISRLKWHLKSSIDILVLELGANDGLRGLKLNETEKNLKAIIHLAKEKNIKILLLGLLMPPNYGIKYTTDFQKMYKNISQAERIPLLPFLLKNVVGIAELNLADGIHPNAKGHELVAADVTRFIEKHLTK